jgi:glycogen(starch) synthase
MTTAAGSTTPERLRPLWLTETYPPSRGGMAQSCDRIVRGLRDGDVAVDVVHFTRRARAPWAFEEQRRGSYLGCVLDEDHAHGLNRTWNAISTRPNAPTHVVSFGGALPLLAGPVYAAWLGVPHIALIRGNDFDTGVFSPRRREVLNDALSRSALVCAVSQDKVERVAALHPGVRVRRIPNGIGLEDWRFAPSDVARARAWRDSTMATGRRVIGVFGQLKRKKGGMFLLESLLRSGRAEQFHVVMAGVLDPEMEAWLAEHELDHTLLPFLDRHELLPWYAACDFVAIPSFYDGLPNVLVEAAALGVPLIAARTGGMADVLRDGETALLFEPGDEAGCCWALERATRLSVTQLKEMGSACRALAAAELDARVEASRYVTALEDTLAAAPPVATELRSLR